MGALLGKFSPVNPQLSYPWPGDTFCSKQAAYPYEEEKLN